MTEATPREALSETLVHSPGMLARIRNRILGGLLLTLPIVLTFWLVYKLASLLHEYVIEPVARLILLKDIEAQLHPMVQNLFSPIVAGLVVLLALYLMGHLFQTRLNHWFDRMLLKIPGVTTLYGVLRNVFTALRSETGLKKVERVVLVAFPHPGMRMAGYVTASAKDAQSGKTILAVYIPIALFPPSGYTLLVPADDVIDTKLTVENALELILSGGMTIPPKILFGESKPQA